MQRNESANQETLFFKIRISICKRKLVERVTCFTQLGSDLKIELKPEFAFKSKSKGTHLTSPKGVYYQWTPKGSYQIEQILGMFDRLPNRFNTFTEQFFAILVTKSI